MTVNDNREAWHDRYRSGVFLAPMVRVGTLPMRLLCLRYGADLVWSPEIIDKSIVGCERQVDSRTGVISYMKGDRDIFTTHPSEKDKLVFQIGSAEPEAALAAAKTVEQDVSGFDLNCGCPKKFSIQGGMGAALMADPDRLCTILEMLVKNVSVPVTCKIRVFDNEEKTLALVRRIAATGVSALTVHCRTKDMRPAEKAMWHRLGSIVKAVADLPIILNGDIFAYKDAQRARDSTGATSVMTARGAAANPSIFRAEGKLDTMEAVIEYAKLAVRTCNTYHNTKYTLLQMYPDTKSQKYINLRSAKQYDAMCNALELGEFYRNEGALLISQNTEAADCKAGLKEDNNEHPSSRKRSALDATLSLDASTCGNSESNDNTTGIATETPAKRIKA